MDKGHKLSFGGEKVFFATKHSKETVLKPVLARLGLDCVRLDLDTDRFGTFSGEVDRVGGVLDTLRMKTNAAAKLIPEARFLLASEGSFGPHPFMGFISSDHEALLLIDRKLETEIYVEEISTETNLADVELGPNGDLNAFLNRIGFPEHGVIVKPKGNTSVVQKNLKDLNSVQHAVAESLRASPEGLVILSTDMRACFNPTRMKVIEQAGIKLIEALSSPCPACDVPGFAIKRVVPGLPCEDCGLPSRITKDVIWSCVKCDYTEQKERPDGLLYISASNCDFCNP